MTGRTAVGVRALRVAVGLLAAAVLLGLVLRDRVPVIDAAVHRFATDHRPGLVGLARVVTTGGSWPAVVLLVAAAITVMLARRGRPALVEAGVLAVAALTAVEARLALSIAVGRARPPLSDRVVVASGYSFPSGHTTAATVGAAAALWVVHRTVGGVRTRRATWIAAVVFAAAVGWSRIWLGVHWPTDVFGGWMFGAGWMTGAFALISMARGGGALGTGGPQPTGAAVGRAAAGAVAAGREPAQGVAKAAQRRWLSAALGSAGVRTRLALASAMVMALALSAATLGGWWLLQRSLTQAATEDVVARVTAIADDVAREGLTATDLDHRPLYGEVVQVLGPADVVLAAAPASATTLDLDLARPTGGRTSVRRVAALPQSGADEPYVLAARLVREPGNREVVVVVGRSESGVQETIGAVGKFVLGLLPLLVLLTGGGTYWFTGRALAPVEAVRRRVDAISSDRLDERVPVPVQRDEVGRLARTMNDMLARLQAAHDAQRRFVADAGHELRSPLATIAVTLDVARAEKLVDDENAGLLDDLQAETDRMSRLVDDLLLLAKADERGLPLRLEDVDLDELAELEAQRLAATVGHRLTVKVRTVPVRLQGDRDRLQQVLRNLLDNASCHARTTVLVEVDVDDAQGRLRVTDDGPGVPAQDRARVFDRFVRLETARSRDTGGSGLGLAIVREIVTAHSGRVAAGDSPGGGATFEVRLPRLGAGRSHDVLNGSD